ncbi:MAG: BadF/BadG/BcrA/BcrD ATPase family protein [Candidatus Limnocylindrales bacterium]
MTRLLLGVDGGGTKTIALIADGAGHVLGAGRSGSSDIHNEVSPQVAVDNIVEAVREAVRDAQVSLQDLDACVFGLCGADWPEDVVFYADTLEDRLGLLSAPVVTNDAFNALRAGTEDGIGVALVLGTGGAIAARGRDGRSWFSGEFIESTGALELGRRAYELVIRGTYGSGPPPSYQAAALARFDAPSIEAFVHAITRVGGEGRRSLARLAPVLMQAGLEGDRMANLIMREHGEILAGYIRRAADRVGLAAEGTRLVLAGGTFRHGAAVLRDALAAGVPGFELRPASCEPAHGALLSAGDVAGVKLDPIRLIDTGPEAGFFRTVPSEQP